MKTQQNAEEKDAQPKSDQQVEQEFPGFLNQLKWTLISDKIVQDNAIQVSRKRSAISPTNNCSATWATWVQLPRISHGSMTM